MKENKAGKNVMKYLNAFICSSMCEGKLSKEDEIEMIMMIRNSLEAIEDLGGWHSKRLKLDKTHQLLNLYNTFTPLNGNILLRLMEDHKLI